MFCGLKLLTWLTGSVSTIDKSIGPEPDEDCPRLRKYAPPPTAATITKTPIMACARVMAVLSANNGAP